MYSINSIFILLMVSNLTFGDTTYYYETISQEDFKNQYEVLSTAGVFETLECKSLLMEFEDIECGDYFKSKFSWIEESFEHLPSDLTIGNRSAENYPVDQNSSRTEIPKIFVNNMIPGYCDVELNLNDTKIRREFALFCTNIVVMQSMLYCMQKGYCPIATVNVCFASQNDFHFVKNTERGVLEVFMNQEIRKSGRCKIEEKAERHEEKVSDFIKTLYEFGKVLTVFSPLFALMLLCCISEKIDTRRKRAKKGTKYIAKPPKLGISQIKIIAV